jgi:hypothetical protein
VARHPGTVEPRRFAIVEPGAGVRFGLWMLCAVLPIAVTALALGIILASTPAIAPSSEQQGFLSFFTLMVILGITMLTLPMALWLHRSLARSGVTFDGGQLDIRAGWYRLTLSPRELDLDKARIVDLDEHVEYRPSLKTNAIALPGFRAGHFRLRDWRRKAFCLLTARQRVLVLPERSGRTLLLSLREPRSLLDALRAG